jgi:hypothetical protein
MKRFFVAFVCLIVCAGVSVARKGRLNLITTRWDTLAIPGRVKSPPSINKYRTLTFASGFYLPGRSLRRSVLRARPVPNATP